MAKYDSIPVTNVGNFSSVPISATEEKFNTVAAKTDALNSKFSAVQAPGLDQFEGPDYLAATKRASVAFEKFDKEMLDMQLRYQLQNIQNGYSDVDAFMGDEFARSGLGYLVNQAGSLVSGSGYLINTIASSPQAMLEVGEHLFPGGKAPDTVSEQLASGDIIRPFFKALDLGGDAVESFLSKFNNDTDVVRTHEELVQAFEDGSGFVDVFSRMAQVTANNADQIPAVIGQSLPMMFALAARGSVGATAYLGMTNQYAAEALDKFKLKNGKDPSPKETALIYAGAVVSATVETVESRFLLGKVFKNKAAVSAKRRALGIAVAPVTGAVAEGIQEGTAAAITEITSSADPLAALTDSETYKDPAAQTFLGAGAGAGIKVASETAPASAGATLKVAADATEKVAQGASSLAAKVSTDPAKRMEQARNEGNAYKFVQSAIDIDLTEFETSEQRNAHLADIFEALQAIDISELSAEQVTDVQTKVASLAQEAGRLNDIQNNRQTLKDAEAVLAENAENIEAVKRVVEGIQEGETISESTVASIKGSSTFTRINPADQELVNAYDEYQKTEQDLAQSKTLFEVAQDIASGNKGDRFLGIEDQRRIVQEAIGQGDYAKAEKALNQIANLRERLLTKLREPNPRADASKGIDDTHAPVFVNQVAKEINALTNAMRLLDTVTLKNFGQSPLSETDLATPDIQVFKRGKFTEETTASPTKGTREKVKQQAKSVEPKKDFTTKQDTAAKAKEITAKVRQITAKNERKGKAYKKELDSIRDNFRSGKVDIDTTFKRLRSMERRLNADFKALVNPEPAKKPESKKGAVETDPEELNGTAFKDYPLAKKILDRVPEKLQALVPTIVFGSSEATFAGRAMYEARRILVNPIITVKNSPNRHFKGLSLEEQMSWVITHEFGHFLDHYTGFTLSEESSVSIKDIGDIYEASTDEKFKDRFSLIFDPDGHYYNASETSKQHETVAQLVAWYLNDPKSFKKIAPDAFNTIKQYVNMLEVNPDDTVSEQTDQEGVENTGSEQQEAVQEPNESSSEEVSTEQIIDSASESTRLTKEINSQEEVTGEGDAPTQVGGKPSTLEATDDAIDPAPPETITPQEFNEQTVIPLKEVEGFQDFLDIEYTPTTQGKLAKGLDKDIVLADGSTISGITYRTQIDKARNMLRALQEVMRTTCDK